MGSRGQVTCPRSVTSLAPKRSQEPSLQTHTSQCPVFHFSAALQLECVQSHLPPGIQPLWLGGGRGPRVWRGRGAEGDAASPWPCFALGGIPTEPEPPSRSRATP